MIEISFFVVITATCLLSARSVSEHIALPKPRFLYGTDGVPEYKSMVRIPFESIRMIFVLQTRIKRESGRGMK